ncbi:MAG: BatA domain-containing protein [Bacteroidia bacterium]
MTLIYPIGLLAMLGIIIPVLIHLWSVKKGRTLKIGSVALLGENSTASSKNLKLTDLFLFILRCLILILIAFILSQPVYRDSKSNAKDQGWLLIDRSQFPEIYSFHQTTIDSLLNLGFELRDLNFDFQPYAKKDTTKKLASTGLSYQALISQLNTQIPTGYEAYVFANNRVINFNGDLIAPSFRMVWKNVLLHDSIKTWSAKFQNNIYEATSTPRLTHYKPSGKQRLPSISVAIYDPNKSDSRYVKAAMSAISDFTKMTIEMVDVSKNPDVLFWLSEKPVTAASTTLFSYKSGEIENVNSWIQISKEANQTIGLKQRVAFDGRKGEVIWSDGHGDPILVKENKTNRYYFYSRLNPQWNDLVWSEEFVKAILPIVFGKVPSPDFGFEDHEADQRILGQAPFDVQKTDRSKSSGTITEDISLVNWLWGFTFFILALERIISFRKKNHTNVAG